MEGCTACIFCRRSCSSCWASRSACNLALLSASAFSLASFSASAARRAASLFCLSSSNAWAFAAAFSRTTSVSSWHSPIIASLTAPSFMYRMIRFLPDLWLFRGSNPKYWLQSMPLANLRVPLSAVAWASSSPDTSTVGTDPFPYVACTMPHWGAFNSGRPPVPSKVAFKRIWPACLLWPSSLKRGYHFSSPGQDRRAKIGNLTMQISSSIPKLSFFTMILISFSAESFASMLNSSFQTGFLSPSFAVLDFALDEP